MVESYEGIGGEERGARSEELDNNNNADNEVSSPLVSSNPVQELYWW